MKKNIMLLAAGALLLMGGCSKSEIDEGSINATSAISFSASSNRVTKASAVTNDNATDYNFGVFAYYTESTKWENYTPSTTPNFMNNEEVSYDSSNGWTYDPVKYWPNTSGEMISFFGYMPYSGATSASIGTGGVPTIVFTQTMNAQTMEDLVVAKALDQTKTTSAVVLPFDHVLSRLNFAAKVDHTLVEDDGTLYSTKVFVKKLRILGTAKNEDVETSTDMVEANSASKFYNTASYIMSADTDDNGAWDYDATLAAQGDALDATAILSTSTQSFGAKNPAYSTESVAINQAGSSTSLLTSGEYLFLIPPSENGVESATDVVIQVDYDIVTADAAVDAGYTLSSTTATLSMPNGTLKEGVAYNVVMTIGLTEVTLSAEPTDWSDTEEEVDAIPTEVTVYSETGIVEAIEDAFEAGVSEYTVNYEGNDESLSLDLSSASDNLGMDLIINIPSTETKTVEITVPTNYTGAVVIDAPNATVTINGDSYENLTVWTADNTLIIPAGVTVNGLTINAGNVTVYGTLTGEVTAGSELVSSTITFMSGSTNSIANSGTLDTKITINDVPTEDGVYYSLDGGEWTAISGLSSSTTGSSIKVMGVGSSTLSYSNLTTIVACDFEEVDLGDVQYSTTAFSDVFRTSTSNGNAMDNPRKLRYISLPSNTMSLPTSAFNSCDKLETVDIPSSLITLNAYAFAYCTSLKSFAFNENTTVYSRVFSNCTNLKVEGFENITSMPGNYTFTSCENLGSELVFNDAVTLLGNNAFDGCTSLTKVTLPESLETMGNYIFYGCTNLSEINIPSGLTSMGTYSFAYTAINNSTWTCTNITEVPDYTFYNCPNITSFTIPETITKLGTCAFAATGITGTLTIPNSVNSIGVLCYYNSNNITEILFESGSNTDDLVIYDRGLTNEYIEKITFPSGRGLDFTTQSVDWAAFHLCYRLKEIVCPSTEVPAVDAIDFGYIATSGICTYVGSLVSEGTDKVLYVPNGYKDAYMAETIEVNGVDQENYWSTVLLNKDKCGFEIKELDSNGNIPDPEV